MTGDHDPNALTINHNDFYKRSLDGTVVEGRTDDTTKIVCKAFNTERY
jgi:hypothetical protein